MRERVRSADVAKNRQALADLDPEAAERLNAGDTMRIARALEVVLSTGRTLKQWQEHREGGIAPSVDLKAIVLLPPRPWLYERCDRRFEQMMQAGAAREVERLLMRGLPPELPVMRAIGVREIAAMLRGEIGRDEALAAGQQATRNYAKRQYTWFSRQPPPEWIRFTDALDGNSLTAALALLGARP